MNRSLEELLRRRTVRRGGHLVLLTRSRDASRTPPRARLAGRRVHLRPLLWEIRHGPIPAGHAPVRRCRVENCIEPRHQFLATPEEIELRRVARLPRGEWHPLARATDAQVRAALAAPTSYASPGTIAPLAASLGVSPWTVRAWRAGRNRAPE